MKHQGQVQWSIFIAVCNKWTQTFITSELYEKCLSVKETDIKKDLSVMSIKQWNSAETEEHEHGVFVVSILIWGEKVMDFYVPQDSSLVSLAIAIPSYQFILVTWQCLGRKAKLLADVSRADIMRSWVMSNVWLFPGSEIWGPLWYRVWDVPSPLFPSPSACIVVWGCVPSTSMSSFAGQAPLSVE